MKKDITLDDLLLHAKDNKDKTFNLDCCDTCLAANFAKDWMDGFYSTSKGRQVPRIFGDFCKHCVVIRRVNFFTGNQLYKAIDCLKESEDILLAYRTTQNV